MHSFLLIPNLKIFSSQNIAELQFREHMLELISTQKRCFHRDCFPAHFTGSALIIEPETHSILLNHHRALNKWLQFGGHCDGNENIFEVAYREAVEESGITSLKTLSQTFVDLDIHPIPANPKRKEPAHFHYDVRFVFAASRKTDLHISDESHALKWFSLTEIKNLRLDQNLIRLIDKAISLATTHNSVA